MKNFAHYAATFAALVFTPVVLAHAIRAGIDFTPQHRTTLGIFTLVWAYVAIWAYATRK
jgi:hypothetical protein